MVFVLSLQLAEVQLQNPADSELPSWMRPPKDSPGEGAELAEPVEESEKISAAEKSLLQKVIRKGLVDSHHDLEIQRKDPTSPLYSVKSFAALNLLVLFILQLLVHILFILFL